MNLIQLIVAKRWAEYNIRRDTVLAAATNARNTIDVLPAAGYRQAIVYKITPTILLPHEAGFPIVDAGSVTTSSQTTYSNVVSHDISGTRAAALSEIMLDTDNWAGTQWRISLNGTEQFTDQVFNSAPSFLWRHLTQSPELNNDSTATDRRGRFLVQARSAAGASITAYAAIVLNEYDPSRNFTLEATKGGNIGIGSIDLGASLVNNGLDVWAYIRNDDPLQYVLTNIGGMDGQKLVIQTAMLGIQNDEKLRLIQDFIDKYGMPLGDQPAPVLLH